MTYRIDQYTVLAPDFIQDLRVYKLNTRGKGGAYRSEFFCDKENSPGLRREVDIESSSLDDSAETLERLWGVPCPKLALVAVFVCLTEPMPALPSASEA